MSGVTDLPFRRLVKSFGASLVISEMIASRAMILQTRESLKKCQKDDAHYPMSVQLAGCEPEVMAETPVNVPLKLVAVIVLVDGLTVIEVVVSV